MSIKFEEMYPVENGNICLKLYNMESKLEILGRKKILRGQKIWLGDNWTPREAEVQNWIYKIAENEIENGNNVRVGYQKITINGEKLV